MIRVMARVAVVGVGAIGGVVAAALSRSSQHELLLCTRRPCERLVVDGPAGRTELRLSTYVDPGRVSRVDTVLLATKAHQTKGAAAWLSRLCDQHTSVIVLQNGVEHRERVAPLVRGATVVPCIVDCPSTRPEPGRVRVTREFRAQLPATPAGRRSAKLLAGAGLDAAVTEDFVTAAWQKLCVNVISGPIPALCDQPRGVFRYPPITELARALVRECVLVGRAEGARLELGLVDQVVAARCNGPPAALTSMLLDRRSGRLLETDSRNGAVVRAGKRHDIATPANAFVLAVLSAVNRAGLDR
jgi:2-dehydropantoate 2-reductase